MNARKMLATLLLAALSPHDNACADEPATAATLFDTILALDTAAFEEFNHCDQTGRLQRHAEYFAPDVEFYHDTGGVTWTRDEMLGNTAKYVCGNFRRELIAGTFRVYPIKDFGAISQGEHRFCQIATGACDGLADFTIVWKKQDDRWVMTRVLSYGHRSADAAKANP